MLPHDRISQGFIKNKPPLRLMLGVLKDATTDTQHEMVLEAYLLSSTEISFLCHCTSYRTRNDMYVANHEFVAALRMSAKITARKRMS